MKRILVLILCALLMGCATTARKATTGSNEIYRIVMDSWLGADIHSFTSTNGSPHKTFSASNGNIVYMWSKTKKYMNSTSGKHKEPPYKSYGFTEYQSPGTATVYGQQRPTPIYDGQSINKWCNTYVETDSNGRIVEWRGEGNNCQNAMKMQNP
jgi:hypothetical protein